MLLVLALLAVTAPFTAASPAAARTADPKPLVPSGVGPLPGTSPEPVPLAQTKPAAPRCADVRKDLARYAGKGDPVACYERPTKATPLPRNHPAFDDVPDWCINLQRNVWWVLRYDGCLILPGRIDVFDPRTGQLVGQLEFLELHHLFSTSGVVNWYHRLAVAKVRAWGFGIGSSVRGTTRCHVQGECRLAGGNGFPDQAIDVGRARGDWLFRSGIRLDPPGAINYHKSSYETWFTNPSWAGPSVGPSYETVHVRCDRAVPGEYDPGCVMPDFRPVLQYSLTGPYREAAQHISEAQRWLPWAYGREPLERLTDAAKIRQNRQRACPESLPRPPGKQCDEYAFASTHQGAAISGRYSRKMIDKNHNEGAGTELGNFYRTQRVIEKEKFFVRIVP